MNTYNKELAYFLTKHLSSLGFLNTSTSKIVIEKIIKDFLDNRKES